VGVTYLEQSTQMFLQAKIPYKYQFEQEVVQFFRLKLRRINEMLRIKFGF